MESAHLDRFVHHIIAQLCERDRFAETILLIDPKKGPFQRQYTEGNLSKLLEKANDLREKNVIDRILISPGDDQKEIIATTNEQWFGIRCAESHAGKGSPVFPQVWSFEQVTTRYILQTDADVIIGRASYEHDVIGEMKEALQEKNVFSVGFNIPQQESAVFMPYDAPEGRYVPEIRLGLLDIERMMEQRPFPNNIVEGKLNLNWHRSIEQYQEGTGWRSLRGGDPRSFFIHPPNRLKNDLTFLDRVIDLTEQHFIPAIQRTKWDLTGDIRDWQYPKRTEPLIVLINGKNPGIHWARSCLVSLLNQEDIEWGAIIIDDASSPSHQRWLGKFIKDHLDRITLVKCRLQAASIQFIHEILDEVCNDPDQIIIRMCADESFFDVHTLRDIQRRIAENYHQLWGATYFCKHPLGLGTIEIDDTNVGTIDKYNVPIALRAVRLRELANVRNHFLDFRTIHGENPIHMERDALLAHGYLFYSNHSFFQSPQRTKLRPTTFIPNMKRMEIDITYDCNLRCPGCCRSCSQAPSKIHMPIEMIHDFLKVTEQRGITWESVHILGGEPTLHPHFHEIIMVLNDWFEHNSPMTDLKVISNGTGNKVNKALDMMPQRWRYNNSFKDSHDTTYFEPFNMAPADLPAWQNEDFRKGCYITQDSGIGLTPFGYFHCAIAGGIERIMRLGYGFNELPRHPWEFLEMMKTYCRYCGHFLNDTHKSKSEQQAMGISPCTMTVSWENAYHQWRLKNP